MRAALTRAPCRTRQRPLAGGAARLSGAELKELGRSSKAAAAAKPKAKALSDAAPPPAALAVAGVVRLNVVKRDLRGVVAAQQDLRARKEPRTDDPPPPAA